MYIQGLLSLSLTQVLLMYISNLVFTNYSRYYYDHISVSRS